MQERYTPFLKQQFDNEAIAKQYQILPTDITNYFQQLDPLSEDTHQPVKNLIHKYHNRALIKISYRCAAHCRFCTRIRQIGTNEGDLDGSDGIVAIMNYLKSHTEITDVILSGGDPLYTPKQTIEVLQQLALIDSVKVIRIGTRLPVHNPPSFKTPLLLQLLDVIKNIAAIKPFYILIHFEHPAELTTETIAVIKQLKQLGVTLLSQSVFLKGINDDFETLKALFEGLYWNGVTPYYMYRCDYVQGLEHFVCDMKDEIAIMTKLRSTLSGIAYPTYIVDVEGTGKIPVPLGFWNNVDLSKCTDFLDTQIQLL